MWRRIAAIFIALAAAAVPLAAQDTPTPIPVIVTVVLVPASPTPTETPTPGPSPTPTETPTATPDTAVLWALPTTVNAEGTPEPTQYARFIYEFSAGELAVSLLLAALLFTVLAVTAVWLLMGRRAK